MKDNTGYHVIIWMLMTFLGAFLILALITKSENIELKRQAIQLGVAEHNPTNGVWQWKTNSLPLPKKLKI